MPAPTFTYDLAFHSRLDGVAVLQTFVDTGVRVTDTVTVAGAGHNLDGSHKLISTEPYLFLGVDSEGDLLFDYDVIMENQMLFTSAYSNLDRATASGTVLYMPVCTWADENEVLDWLGIDPATTNDADFVAVCTEAANAFAYRRRRAAGYTDSLTVVPDASVKLGTIQYAGMLYRERGTAGDNFAAFNQFGAVPITGSMGQIMRLLGINRARIA